MGEEARKREEKRQRRGEEGRKRKERKKRREEGGKKEGRGREEGGEREGRRGKWKESGNCCKVVSSIHMYFEACFHEHLHRKRQTEGER